MHFNFSEEQLAFRQSVSDMLGKETADGRVRSLWDTATGRSPELWAALAQMGLTGILVPDNKGGLGLSELDFALLLEEVGRRALAEPLAETAAVAAPLLAQCGNTELADKWLPQIADGQARIAIGHDINPAIADAHVSDLIIICRRSDSRVYAIEPDHVELTAQPSVDPGSRLFCASWQPSNATVIAEGDEASSLAADAVDRGALAAAAELIGVGQQLIDLAVAYAKERQQFGRPIGSFQAVKHMLAAVQVRVEFARPVVARAAFSVANASPDRALDVSQAKTAAGQAALLAAKTALQVHGAIGYTFELDLHVWMKRAWSLEARWGTSLWHRRRVGDALLAADSKVCSFGQSR